MESAIWGFIGTLVGALASIATNIITSRNAAQLQGAAARFAREDEGRSFQRVTLLSLQDELQHLLRQLALVHLADKTAAATTGSWGRAFLGEALDADFHEAIRAINKTVERVADDDLRTEVKRLKGLIWKVPFARSAHEAQQALDVAMTVGVSAMENVGTVLRRQY